MRKRESWMFPGAFVLANGQRSFINWMDIETKNDIEYLKNIKVIPEGGNSELVREVHPDCVEDFYTRTRITELAKVDGVKIDLNGLSVAKEVGELLDRFKLRHDHLESIAEFVVKFTEEYMRFQYESRYDAAKLSGSISMSTHDHNLLSVIAELASDETKIKMMRISTEGLKNAIKAREKEPIVKLREMLSKNIVCRAYGEPIDLNGLLFYYDLPYNEEKLRRLTKSGKIPAHIAEKVIEFIEEEYKIEGEEEHE